MSIHESDFDLPTASRGLSLAVTHSQHQEKFMNQLSIAIDGGHSMFKLRAAFTSSPEKRIVANIPTVVVPAFPITNEQTRLRAENETVEIAGRKYFVGETAIRQGRSEVFTGQNDEWVNSVQHDALMLGAWKKVMRSVGSQPVHIHLITGLPAKFFGSQRDLLKNRISNLLSPRLFPGQTLKVIVQSQADAPLQWLSIHNNGTLNKQRDLDTESWGVIEIGHYTTDFSLSDRGSIIEYASVSCPGVSMVYDAVASALVSEKIPATIENMNSVVQEREIQWFGKVKDMRKLVDTALLGFESTVLDEADRLFGQQGGMLNGIIIGGGGASLLSAKIQQRFPNAIVGNEPRSMVAEGFCRLGLLSFAN